MVQDSSLSQLHPHSDNTLLQILLVYPVFLPLLLKDSLILESHRLLNTFRDMVTRMWTHILVCLGL